MNFKKKSYGLLLTLLPKQPLGTPTTFFDNRWLTPTPLPRFFPPSFFFGKLTEHCTDTLWERKRTPDYTFQMTYLWQQHYTRHLVRWPTQYHLQCWTTEQLHKFPKRKKKTEKKRNPLVFKKDWMNNVASLLTYCSICWLGNNLTSFIIQFAERGNYAFKGSFRCHFPLGFLSSEARKYVKREYMRDKGLVLLIEEEKKCTENKRCVPSWSQTHIIKPHSYDSPSSKLSTCTACLPLNLCLPFTSIRLKHCPLHEYWDNQKQH